MFWSIFLNSLVLIIAVLVVGWVIDTIVRKLSSQKSDNV